MKGTIIMRNNRRFGRVLAIIMCVTMLASTVSAFGYDKPDAVDFTYSSSFKNAPNNRKLRSQLYYTDDYFSEGADKQDDVHLRTASLALAIAASYRNAKSIGDAMNKLDFSEAVSQDYVSGSYDTIGVYASNRKLSDGTSLVAVQLRGAWYGCEWGQNFIAGKKGDADGYSYPAKKVLKFIDKYYSDQGIDKSKSKLWIVGYSRAGSVTNLVAKTLSDEIGKENVYAYCFDSPKSSVTGDKLYTNIHNVQNNNDAFTYFLPSYMGFKRNGADAYLLGNSDKEVMAMHLAKLVGQTVYENDYLPLKSFNWTRFKLNLNLASPAILIQALEILGGKPFYEFNESEQSASVDKVMRLLEKRLRYAIPTRKDYVESGMQDGLTAVGILSQKLTDRQTSKLLDLLKDTDTLVTLAKNPNLFMAIREIQRCGRPRLTDCQYKSIANTVIKALVDKAQSEGILDEAEAKTARAAVNGLIKPLIKFIAVDYNSKYQLLGTLIYEHEDEGMNLMKMVQCHYLDVNLAWAMSEDSYYNTAQ